jgi:indole-3-glycerol phosphate synthase
VQTSFLDDMVVRRSKRILGQYGDLSPADRERLACCSRPVRDFALCLSDRLDVAVIAEVKKVSPASGPIAPECDAAKQALHYQYGGASAISVLTEPESFGGSFSDLSDVADAIDIPVLAKDFVVDPVQAFVARGHGADAILLMVSVLGDKTAEYVDIAQTLGMSALVEVVNPAELDIALRAGAHMVAVNNRDLHSLRVDVAAARATVAEAAQSGVAVVVASGTRYRADVEAAASAGADAVLVGEALMREAFPEDLLEELTGVMKEPP